MKKILFVLMLLNFCFNNVKSQALYDSNKVRQLQSVYGFTVGNYKFKSIVIGTDTIRMAQRDSGGIAFKDAQLFIWTGSYWKNAASVNIYNSNGSATGPRTYNGGGYPLTFNNISNLNLGSTGSTTLDVNGNSLLYGSPTSTNLSVGSQDLISANSTTSDYYAGGSVILSGNATGTYLSSQNTADLLQLKDDSLKVRTSNGINIYDQANDNYGNIHVQDYDFVYRNSQGGSFSVTNPSGNFTNKLTLMGADTTPTTLRYKFPKITSDRYLPISVNGNYADEWGNVTVSGGGADSSIFATQYRLDTVKANLRTAINLKQNQLNGTGFVKASGTTISYDNSTYLTTSSATSTYAPIASPTFTGTVTIPNGGVFGTPTSVTLTNAAGLPVSTGISGLGSGVATWLGSPSWTNFNSAITGTAPYWSLATGGTATGTNTITMGSNPLIISTGVTTGTGATAGHQIVANSLTTGNANDYSSSSITTGNILKLTSTSTAANAFSLLNINSSGANANSTRIATGQTVSVTNTGTTSTNVGVKITASGATTNYPLITSGGFVGINNLTPNMELSVGGAINLTTQTSDLAKPASLVSHTNGFMYMQGSTNGLIIADDVNRNNYIQIRSNSASSPNEITFNQGTGKAGFLYGGGTLDANKIVGDAQHLFEISNNATASQVFRMSTYGSGAVTGQNNMHFVRMGGTVTSPTQTLSGMYFISMGFRGRDNANTNGQSVAAIQVLAAEDFTASAQGTQFNVQLAPIGSISRTDVIRAYGTGVGILQTSPTAKLHIGAGTATAGTAPQKYSSGVLLTTIEAFAKEANANGTYQSTNALNRFADGGKIYGTSTDVSNSGTGETDLVTYTTKASTLAATDESLVFDIAGTLNDITATAQLQFYFGGTNIGNTGALTVSATGGWSARVIIVRSGSTTAKAMVTVTTPGASTAQYTTVTSVTGLTFTNTNIIKCTGTAGGAGGGTGDITMSVAQLNWWGASNN